MNFVYTGAVKNFAESEPHSHDIWEAVYYAKGKVILTIDGTDHKLGAGTFVLQPKGLPHSEKGQPVFDIFYFLMKENLFLPKRTVVVEDTPDKTILRLFRILNYNYNAKRRNYLNTCEALMNSILHYVAGLEENVYGTDAHILRFTQILIDAIPDSGFKIADAMAETPFTSDYFRKLFVAHTGHTPREYLNELRVNNAMDLMTIPAPAQKLPLKSIAYVCGFSDPLYFSRVFKKRVGVAPSLWNKRNETRQ